MNRYVLAIVVLSAGLSCVAGCQTLRDVKNPLANAYSGLDNDGDGVISEQEARESPPVAKNFARIDTNSSGGVDKKEYAAVTTHVARVRFEDADVNEDGVISKREAAAMPVSLNDAFDELDADGDNNVSPTEYRAASVNLFKDMDFSSLDTDGDGVISTMEAEKMPALSEAFKRLDSDADGMVSKKEFLAAQR